MSRIGKQPVVIAAGIDVSISNGILTFKSNKGQLDVNTKNNVDIKIENDLILVSAIGNDRQAKAYWGLYRSLIANAITGLVDGYKKSLEINGVGYRASIKGKILELLLGYSHPVIYDLPEGVKVTVTDNTKVSVEGADKQVVGQVAAVIRGFRKPEPYKGKGIRYVGERIVMKEGKTVG